MRHYEPHRPVTQTQSLPVNRLVILEARKESLEGRIREAFRKRRAATSCDATDVSHLSAALRKVKAEIAACGRKP